MTDHHCHSWYCWGGHCRIANCDSGRKGGGSGGATTAEINSDDWGGEGVCGPTTATRTKPIKRQSPIKKKRAPWQFGLTGHCNTFWAKYFSIFHFSFVFRNFCVRRGEGRRHGGAARPARPRGPARALAATNAKIEKRGGQASERPGVRTPGRPGVRASGRPSARTSGRPSVRISENVKNLIHLFFYTSFQTRRYLEDGQCNVFVAWPAMTFKYHSPLCLEPVKLSQFLRNWKIA